MILTKKFTDIGSFSVNRHNTGLFSHVHQPISDGVDFWPRFLGQSASREGWTKKTPHLWVDAFGEPFNIQNKGQLTPVNIRFKLLRYSSTSIVGRSVRHWRLQTLNSASRLRRGTWTWLLKRNNSWEESSPWRHHWMFDVKSWTFNSESGLTKITRKHASKEKYPKEILHPCFSISTYLTYEIETSPMISNRIS